MISTLTRRFKHLFTQPRKTLEAMVVSTRSLWPDKAYLSLLFWCRIGKKMPWKNPRTYNEKLQWLKLYNRRPEYTMMVDKIKVKDYVAKILGEDYIIPTLGTWDDPDKILFETLPDSFVLKCNHNSGLGMFICKDKSKMDIIKVKEGLRSGLKEDYYGRNREWPYKNVPHRILAEKYIEPDSNTMDLLDYKVFCFDGEPRLIEVDYDRFINHKRNLYTPEWERISATLGFPTDRDRDFTRPTELGVMLDAARKLSKGIPHVRVDFYDVRGKVYFGELTFFHGSGYEKTDPEWLNETMGDWLKLPK